MQQMLRNITAKYHLNGIVLGEFSKIKARGIGFEIWAFHADGLGHVAAVTTRGALGLTGTQSLIVNPTQRDLPLFICRRTWSPGSGTLRCELFDTLLEDADLGTLERLKESYRHLPDHTGTARWSDSMKLGTSLAKQGKHGHTGELDRCAMEYLQHFLEAADNAPYCDPSAKNAKAAVYVEGLLQNGDAAADGFRRSIGREKTDLLYRNILFGIGR